MKKTFLAHGCCCYYCVSSILPASGISTLMCLRKRRWEEERRWRNLWEKHFSTFLQTSAWKKKKRKNISLMFMEVEIPSWFYHHFIIIWKLRKYFSFKREAHTKKKEKYQRNILKSDFLFWTRVVGRKKKLFLFLLASGAMLIFLPSMWML